MSETINRVFEALQPVFRGPTRGVEAAAKALLAELYAEGRLEAEQDRDAAREQQRLGWERAAEKDRAYQAALDERDKAVRERDELRDAFCGLEERDEWKAKAEGRVGQEAE